MTANREITTHQSFALENSDRAVRNQITDGDITRRRSIKNDKCDKWPRKWALETGDRYSVVIDFWFTQRRNRLVRNANRCSAEYVRRSNCTRRQHSFISNLKIGSYIRETICKEVCLRLRECIEGFVSAWIAMEWISIEPAWLEFNWNTSTASVPRTRPHLSIVCRKVASAGIFTWQYYKNLKQCNAAKEDVTRSTT